MEKFKLLNLIEQNLQIFFIDYFQSSNVTSGFVIGYSINEISKKMFERFPQSSFNVRGAILMKDILKDIDLKESQEKITKEQFIFNNKLIANEFIQNKKQKDKFLSILEKI